MDLIFKVLPTLPGTLDGILSYCDTYRTLSLSLSIIYMHAGCPECLHENHRGPWKVRTHNPSIQGLTLASHSEPHLLQDPGAHLQMPARTCSSVLIWLNYLQSTVCQETMVSESLLLTQPKTRTKAGERAFSFAAPRLWNKLPPAVCHSATLEQFKVTPKTHLFRDHYGWLSSVHMNWHCAKNITVHNERASFRTPYTTDLSHILDFKYLPTGQLLKLLV